MRGAIVGVSKRAQDDKQLTEQIRTFHQRSNGTYGAPRIFEDLRGIGVRTSKKTCCKTDATSPDLWCEPKKGYDDNTPIFD